MLEKSRRLSVFQLKLCNLNLCKPMESDAESMYYLERPKLQDLFDELSRREYEIVGPRVDQEAIVYDQIERVKDLPRGWTDEQAPGHYRLKRREDDALFGYVIGPHSWKKYLFPPLVNVMSSRCDSDGWTMQDEPIEPKRFALIGVRACELAAIAVQDRVFMSEAYVDPIYAKRRQGLFIVAVNCTQAAATCFCTSMGTGPRCSSIFDLALTELPSGFVVEVGSPGGQEIVHLLGIRQATEAECTTADSRRQIAVTQITRKVETAGIRDKLLSRLEHPRWQNVAERCLSCANCTLVCPTCFCSSVDDVTDLTNDEVLRQRRWDSCFNFDFSHISGGPIRDQTRSRYRQWLTHKMASWIDQFGTSGCVGCGRCITWCPVGIDLTQEVAAICSDVEQT
jgi:sulfhydrogenase subunit beta (sulfur reductase)